MPFFSKIQRQSDFNLFDSKTPLVIDNGTSYFRIGWAGESEPRVVFRHFVQRPHHKGTGETVTIVGDHDPALLKYFDCTRSKPRSAFDGNVVCQFETMEYILDFGFDRMGAKGTKIDHPVLITECVCNPVRSRSRMAELLFETYGVPSIAFGVDVAFSYKYNQQQGVCAKDGLALCPGFNTTHVIPFVDGEPVYEGCCRTNIGGFHVTNQLKQLLSLKYPYHLARFTWEKVEDLKVEHCYIAPDYLSEARLFQKGAKEAEEKTRYWVPPPVEEPPSEEKDETEKVDPAANEKYSLINIPDNMLTEEQLNEKKKQLSLKSMAEGRQRLKQKRHEKELELERKQQLKKEKRLREDRRLYKLLMKDYNGDEDEDTFRARNEQLYKFLIKDYIGDKEEPDDAQSRISSTPQDRDPTFIPKSEAGTSRPPKVPRVPPLTKKEDFQIPTSTPKSEAGTSRPPKVSRVPPLTKKEDFQIPTSIPKSEAGTSRPPKVPRVLPLTKKEDFQIVLGVERFRCPELLFTPNLIAVDQAGLDEMVGVSIKRLPDKDESLKERLTSSILVTGGSSLFPGIVERLEAGIRMIRPSGAPIKIVRALDPIMDAWRGAASFASGPQFHEQTFSKLDYDEKGEDWLRNYQLQYTL